MTDFKKSLGTQMTIGIFSSLKWLMCFDPVTTINMHQEDAHRQVVCSRLVQDRFTPQLAKN